MAKKTKYLIVRLVSVISNTSKVWVRSREAPEAKGVFYDPAVGKEVLFVEKEHIKGKDFLPPRVKERLGLL
ncbi:hypothetical protein ACQ4LE_007509 [Meloidogyne hapla]|uniref:39S ribosomal protein L33, mitochondrial n=1 Tax=Meloidogyne hapla TaxID=6305 RepID=A0A1I8BLG3_MELHA